MATITPKGFVEELVSNQLDSREKNESVATLLLLQSHAKETEKFHMKHYLDKKFSEFHSLVKESSSKKITRPQSFKMYMEYFIEVVSKLQLHRKQIVSLSSYGLLPIEAFYEKNAHEMEGAEWFQLFFDQYQLRIMEDSPMAKTAFDKIIDSITENTFHDFIIAYSAGLYSGNYNNRGDFEKFYPKKLIREINFMTNSHIYNIFKGKINSTRLNLFSQLVLQYEQIDTTSDFQQFVKDIESFIARAIPKTIYRANMRETNVNDKRAHIFVVTSEQINYAFEIKRRVDKFTDICNQLNKKDARAIAMYYALMYTQN